jgi:cell wall-associated NlpC family hydrolase
MARSSLARRLVVAGAVVFVTRWAVAQAETKPVPVEGLDDVPDAAFAPPAKRHAFRRRFASSLTFATLFFAGAALSAGAGNELAHVDAASTDPAAVAAALPVADATTTDATTADVAPTDVATTEVATTDTAPPTADPTPVETAAAPATPAPTPNPFDDAVRVKSAPAATPAPVAVAATPVAAKPSVQPKRRTIAHVSAPARVTIPLQALAFDPQAWLHDNAASATGAAAVSIAEHYLGVPYVWGGAMPSTGFDCSGLTAFVYEQLGVSLPHYAAAQFAEYPKLDPTELQPGDLVFFEPKVDGPGHVALYIGNDRIIEAPHTGALIRIVSFSGTVAKLGFLGAVRPYVEVAVPYSPVGSVFSRLA